MHGSRKPMDELVTQVRFFAMFSDRPSRVHGRAVLHTEGEKGAVRVQKEAPVHTEGEKGAVRAQKKGLKKGQKILDHMGSTELAANLFRATQAEEKLKKDQVRGKA